MYTLLAILAGIAALYYSFGEDVTDSILYLILGALFIIIDKLGTTNGRR